MLIIGKNSIAYIYFKVNQDYIAHNLCVQKETTDNLCLGNCYLEAIQKRLEQNSNKNNNATPVKYDNSHNLQDYIVIKNYNAFKKEFTQIIHFKNTFQLLIRNNEPLTPPPRFI